MRSFLYRVVCGLVIGIGCVLPGVSGGIMAVSMGLYEGMMGAIGGFFHGVKKNTLFLLPIAIGGGIGILLTSNVLNLVIERYEAPLLALFSGLVLGSVPELFGEARADGGIKPKHIVAAVCGLAFVLLFALGESSVAANEKISELTVVPALIAGAVLSVGTVIPGVSSSFILIYMGLYNAVLSALAGVFDVSALLSFGFDAAWQRLMQMIVPLMCMALSFAAVALLIIKGVNRALAKHHSLCYAAVIGFVIGSVGLIAPGVIAGFSWVTPIAFLLGLAVSLLQYRIKKRQSMAKAQEALPEQVQTAPVETGETPVEPQK